MNELSQESKPSKMAEQVREMVRIWTTLSPSQREDLMQRVINAWCLNQEIDRLRETQTALLNRKLQEEKNDYIKLEGIRRVRQDSSFE